MFPCELSGKLVEAPQSLDSDQERLVSAQAGLGQVGDLIAQVILELVAVGVVECTMLVHVRPPLGDLVFDLLVVRGAHVDTSGSGCAIMPGGVSRHTPRSVSMTVAHWACWAASSALPRSVMR